MKLKNKVMKKVIVVMAIAMSLFACKKDSDNPNDGHANGAPIVELNLSAYHGNWDFDPYVATAGCGSRVYEIREADNHDELLIGTTIVKVTPKLVEDQEEYTYYFHDKDNKVSGRFYNENEGSLIVNKCSGKINKK